METHARSLSILFFSETHARFLIFGGNTSQSFESWKRFCIYRCGKTFLAHMHLQSLFRSLCGNICSCSHASREIVFHLSRKKGPAIKKKWFPGQNKSSYFRYCLYLFNIYINTYILSDVISPYL
jgi:hypothetical protein